MDNMRPLKFYYANFKSNYMFTKWAFTIRFVNVVFQI